jgi:phenylacetate-CoA ligase
VNTDYSFVEILDENNQPTDGEGFVVGTTFHNHLMPLVRYKLSDRTRWKPGACQCGRPYPMIEPIHGKFEDVLLGSTGSPISPSIITFAFKGVANVDSSQVAQVGPGTWEVRVVPGAKYSTKDGDQIVKNIHESVDSGLAVKLVLREKIERTPAGKYRWVVNEWQPEKSSRVS